MKIIIRFHVRFRRLFRVCPGMIVRIEMNSTVKYHKSTRKLQKCYRHQRPKFSPSCRKSPGLCLVQKTHFPLTFANATTTIFATLHRTTHTLTFVDDSCILPTPSFQRMQMIFTRVHPTYMLLSQYIHSSVHYFLLFYL